MANVITDIDNEEEAMRIEEERMAKHMARSFGKAKAGGGPRSGRWTIYLRDVPSQGKAVIFEIDGAKVFEQSAPGKLNAKFESPVGEKVGKMVLRVPHGGFEGEAKEWDQAIGEHIMYTVSGDGISMRQHPRPFQS